MASRTALAEELDSFFYEGIIVGTPRMVRSGKEATVFCCEAKPGIEHEYFAAKVYRARERRSFKHSSMYQEGRVILGGRARRAVAKKTKFGKEAEFALWMLHEQETLQRLSNAGCRVPKPVRMAESAVLMEFIGEGTVPAPQLGCVNLTEEEAKDACRILVHEVERWLSLDIIHGDLSEYNILWHQRAPVVIDFPQAVDPRTNPHAFDLLTHDLESLASFFSMWDVELDAKRVARELWMDWKHGRI